MTKTAYAKHRSIFAKLDNEIAKKKAKGKAEAEKIEKTARKADKTGAVD